MASVVTCVRFLEPPGEGWIGSGSRCRCGVILVRMGSVDRFLAEHRGRVLAICSTLGVVRQF